MDGWIALWTWVFWGALALFYVLVLVVLPLGGRDIVRLFRVLRLAGDRGSRPDDEHGSSS